MGRQSRKKAEARAARLPRADLEQLLEEAVAFLQASAAAFDAGFEAEAKRLAVTLRVLLHDTAQSHSLMKQLKLKDRTQWVDTAIPINPRNLLPSWGLVIVRVVSGQGAQYIAPLNDLSPDRRNPPRSFRVWWDTDILKDQNGELWSRKRMVLHLANKEGGAHVDPSLDDAYKKLVEDNALGVAYVDERGEEPASGNAVAVSVRQITHEVLETIPHAKVRT